MVQSLKSYPSLFICTDSLVSPDLVKICVTTRAMPQAGMALGLWPSRAELRSKSRTRSSFAPFFRALLSSSAPTAYQRRIVHLGFPCALLPSPAPMANHRRIVHLVFPCARLPFSALTAHQRRIVHLVFPCALLPSSTPTANHLRIVHRVFPCALLLSSAPTAHLHTSLGQRPRRITTPKLMRAEGPTYLTTPCHNRSLIS